MNVFVKTLMAASLAFPVATPNAQARVLGVGASINSFDVTATEQAVPLRLNGSRAVTFTTTRDNTVVVVTYNAECVVTGLIGAWIAIRITVDGIAAAPDVDSTFALCSAVDRSVFIPVGASRQAVITVPKAGTHTVRVLAARYYAQSGRLDDSSITIRD